MIRDFNNHRYSKASIQFVEIINELNQKELFEIESMLDNMVENESVPSVKNKISDFGELSLDTAFRKARFDKTEIAVTTQEVVDKLIEVITKPSIGFFIKLNKEGTIESSKIIATRMNSCRFEDYIVFNYSQSSTMVYDFLKLLENRKKVDSEKDKIVLSNLILMEALANEQNPKLKFKKIKKIISEVKRQVSDNDINNIICIIDAVKKKKSESFEQFESNNQEEALVLSQIDLLSAASRELNNLDFTSLNFFEKIQYRFQKKIFDTKGYLYREFRSGIGYFLKW